MTMFRPTFLYVKIHNLTGLKYFGKTIRNPFNYSGSGKRWLNHLKVHGYDVTTKVIGFFKNKEECVNNNIIIRRE